MQTRRARVALAGATIAASIALLAGCGGVPEAPVPPSDTGEPAATATTSAAAATTSAEATVTADAVTTAELEAAIGTLPSGDGSNLTPQVIPGGSGGMPDAPVPPGGMDLPGLGGGQGASTCLETWMSYPSGTGDGVVAVSSGLTPISVAGIADSADRVDLPPDPADLAECATYTVGGTETTNRAVDVTTEGDSTFAYSSDMTIPGLGATTTTSVVTTYRGAFLAVSSTGAAGMEPATTDELADIINQLIAALG